MLVLGSEIPDKPQRGQQALRAVVTSEIARWSPIIKAAGVTAN
jgi:tripartite-type tricarboxylate transporter receptor subunit TctC